MKRAIWILLGLLSHIANVAAAEPVSDLFKTFGHGNRAGYLSPDDDIRRLTAIPDVETPHIVLASPIAGGPLRVLAIAHKSLGRWPVELMQRFDFNVETVYCYSETALGAPVSMTFFGQRQADIEARLLQALNKDIDVIVTEMPLSAFSERIMARLEERMNGGVGYVGLVDAPELPDALPPTEETALVEAAVPLGGLRLLSTKFPSAREAAEAFVSLRQGPSGARVAVLAGYPRDGEAPDPARLQYAWLPSMEQEAWCSLVGRAMLWAAGRLPSRSPLVDALPPTEVSRAELPRAVAADSAVAG